MGRTLTTRSPDTVLGTSSDGSLEPIHLPERIGPYRIVGELGSGGMGTVLLAEQTEPVRRTVALKVMRSHFLDQEGRIRFETERQAMASLQHPNVAQIFEAGATDDGHPYFVMERVDGEPITDYCDRRQLTVKQRLALFLEVCAGVQHAHQKGIIHRDLKPPNILVSEVDGRAVPKIIDFGIAKTFGAQARRRGRTRPGEGAADDTAAGLESSQEWQTGEKVLGTPAYLSPEAVGIGDEDLDLDTRTDIYSLGILLYELLVGRRPFDDADSNLFEVLQRIATADPTGPSTRWRALGDAERKALAESRRADPESLRRQLHGDLDWIVLCAIAKDRRERYDSATALAADIDRHLSHEPVLAGPPSRLYRVRKFVRRRAGSVLAVVGIMLALGAGLVARTLEAERANREKAAAVEARRQTEVALREAERARAEAYEVSQFLAGLFLVSDPGTAKGNTVTARELLDDAAVKVRSGFDDQPLARARFMQQISDIYRKLGLYEESLELALESVALARQHLPDDHPDLAKSLHALATLHAQMGRFEEAEPLARESLAIRRVALEPDDLQIANSLNNLGNLMIDLDRASEGEPFYREALDIARRHEGEPTADQLVALNNLAAYYSDEGRYEEAEPLLRRFLDHLRAEHGAKHPYVAFALENLAEVRWRQGAVDEGEALLTEAEGILVEVLGADHPEVAYCWSAQAKLHAAAGRAERAEALYRRALAIQREAFDADHPELVETLEGLAALGVERR